MAGLLFFQTRYLIVKLQHLSKNTAAQKQVLKTAKHQKANKKFYIKGENQ